MDKITSKENRKFKLIIEELLDSETKLGRRFELIIQSIILLSAISFSIETIPNLPDSVQRLLSYTEWGIVCFFSFEFMLRAFVSSNKKTYLKSSDAIIDVVAILPFYISLLAPTSIDLKLIRMLRLLRIFKLFKHNKSVLKLTTALKEIKDDLALFGGIALGILFISSILMYFAENEAQPDVFASVFHSLWWAVVTLTTVGYGDAYPITLLGRCITFVLLILGIALVSIPAGLLASALSNSKSEKQ